MKSRDELITVQQLRDYLAEEIENGNGDKYVFIGEFFVGSGKPGFDEHIYLEEVHYQDVLDYGDATGDEIDC